jgi:Phosphate-selective porin O and P
VKLLCRAAAILWLCALVSQNNVASGQTPMPYPPAALRVPILPPPPASTSPPAQLGDVVPTTGFATGNVAEVPLPVEPVIPGRIVSVAPGTPAFSGPTVSTGGAVPVVPAVNAVPTGPAGPTTAVATDPEAYGLKSLFDSLHTPNPKAKHWYEKISIRGYTQFRFERTLQQDLTGAAPFLFGDRSINGNAENFSIRRARLILFGDVSEHLGLYIQPDFASTPQGSTGSTFFGQLRDAYGDVYIDTDKVHRIRVGLSKVPFGFENMQSSQNRAPLDRTNPINTGVSPNERDLGAFYYWTPVEKQKLFKDLVDGGLKGSGNYGIVGLGVYNGQGGSQTEQNLNLHAVARVTWPWQLPDGQVVETSLQGFTGEQVVAGSTIRPRGAGPGITPKGTGGTKGHLDQRIAGTFVWYPQPFGVQAEWCVGEGPGLNDAQTAVDVRSLHGGYLMAMYRHDTDDYGILTPFVRWQYYKGGYRSIANAPYGTHDEWNFGIEWQIRKELELVVEYDLVNGPNLNAINTSRAVSYRNFDGGLLRVQFQINY